MKKIFYFFVFMTIALLISSINIFLKINSDINHIIGTDINLILYFFISIICIITTNNIFLKTNLDNSKNYRKDIKIAFANSFFTNSIISIISAFFIYGFLKNILELINIKQSIINYCIFSSKIWFISSPFIGLEITFIKYYYEIGFFITPIKTIIYKLLLFFLISVLLYSERKTNCFLYAKPICDIIFLIYYTKVCFDITLNKT